MSPSELLKITAGLLAFVMYAPLVIGAVRSKGAGQSFAMWALWAVMDSTATLSILVQRGNFWLVLGLAVGSITMAVLLLAYGRFAWGRLETAILLLVVVCLGVWFFSGPKSATIAATLAIVVAGIPGMVELWRNPQRSLAVIWSGFTLANLLALLGGRNWSIEERFAPAAFVLQTLAFVAIAARPKRALSVAEIPGRESP